MKRTLLIDLDNTLLRNEMDSFLPAYLKALSDFMSPLIEADRLIQTLLAATMKMTANNRPDKTLMDAFNETFFPALGRDPAELTPHFEKFYAVEFPRLRAVTTPKPEAIALVQQAQMHGYQLGVATNPLFPRTAILQRLAWAGFSNEDSPFALVPSYDTFHFAKPNPAYFAEFLAQMGWQEGPALMVGDDPELDILPAQRFGLPVFWAPAHDNAAWRFSDEEPPRGSLQDVIAWFEAAPLRSMPVNVDQPETTTAILSATPAALLTFSKQLPAEKWTVRPKPGEWSWLEIICHLRDVDAEVNLPRLKQVLASHNPFLAGQDTDPWAEERQYIRQDGQEALGAMVANRLEILSLLQNLDEAGWNRQARHAIFGPTTLKELVKIIADHDRLHIRQAHALLGM